MARKTRVKVIEELTAREIEFDIDGKYNDLCRLLKEDDKIVDKIVSTNKSKKPQKPTQIKLVSRILKRNTFLSDQHRDERDAEVLRKKIGGREYKGKLKTITTIKNMDVSDDGYWVTEFVIDLK